MLASWDLDGLQPNPVKKLFKYNQILNNQIIKKNFISAIDNFPGELFFIMHELSFMN